MSIQNEPKVIALTSDQITGIKNKYNSMVMNSNQVEATGELTNAELILGDNELESTPIIDNPTAEPVIPVVPEPVVSEINPVQENQAPTVSPLSEISDESQIPKESVNNIALEQLISNLDDTLHEMGNIRGKLENYYNELEILEVKATGIMGRIIEFTNTTNKNIAIENSQQPVEAQSIEPQTVPGPQPEVAQSQSSADIMPFNNDFNLNGGGNIFDVPSEISM